jgi:hypothetical protein
LNEEVDAAPERRTEDEGANFVIDGNLSNGMKLYHISQMTKPR